MSRAFALGVAALVLVDAGLLFGLSYLDDVGWRAVGITLAVVIPAYAGLAYAGRRTARTLGLGGIVLLTLAVQLPGLALPPLTSDDLYRYLWDGRVQLAGINPYAYPPLDPALAGLRDPFLWPAPDDPLLNRPWARTIYPPLAQVWFVLLAVVSPVAAEVHVLQLVGVGLVLATTIALARLLGPRRRLALLYGANPLVMLEAVNAAHLDALAALAMVGFAGAAVRRRHWPAGVLLLLAAGLKLVPLLLVPALLTRGRWRTSLVAVGGVAAGYLPHLLVVGSLTAGFLPGYLAEEGYASGRRFALLAWLPESARLPVAGLAAAVVALVALHRSRRGPLLPTLCGLYGAALLVATPIYPWYALPFLVLVLLAGRLEWLAVWAALYVAFAFDRSVGVQALAYGSALAVVLLVTLRRRRESAASAARRTARPDLRRERVAHPSFEGRSPR